MTHFILFKSEQSRYCDNSEVVNLFMKTHLKNLNKKITGRLIYNNNRFIQYYEGEPNWIQEMYNKIAVDKRHNNIRILSSGPIVHRLFRDWVTGYPIYNNSDVLDIKSMNEHSFFEKEMDFFSSSEHLANEYIKSFYYNGDIDYTKFWTER